MKINKKLILPIGIIVLFVILLSISKVAHPGENLSVQVQPKQVGPQIVA